MTFICKRCGQCCGPIFFTKAEYQAVRRRAKNMGISLAKGEINGKIVYLPRRLAKNLNLPHNELLEMIKNPDLSCPFLGKDKDEKCLCRVYDVRPEVCRLFGTHPETSRRLRCPNQSGSTKNMGPE